MRAPYPISISPEDSLDRGEAAAREAMVAHLTPRDVARAVLTAAVPEVNRSLVHEAAMAALRAGIPSGRVRQHFGLSGSTVARLVAKVEKEEHES